MIRSGMAEATGKSWRTPGGAHLDTVVGANRCVGVAAGARLCARSTSRSQWLVRALWICGGAALVLRCCSWSSVDTAALRYHGEKMRPREGRAPLPRAGRGIPNPRASVKSVVQLRSGCCGRGPSALRGKRGPHPPLALSPIQWARAGFALFRGNAPDFAIEFGAVSGRLGA